MENLAYAVSSPTAMYAISSKARLPSTAHTFTLLVQAGEIQPRDGVHPPLVGSRDGPPLRLLCFLLLALARFCLTSAADGAWARDIWPSLGRVTGGIVRPAPGSMSSSSSASSDEEVIKQVGG